jgi:hypothetical protein
MEVVDRTSAGKHPRATAASPSPSLAEAREKKRRRSPSTTNLVEAGEHQAAPTAAGSYTSCSSIRRRPPEFRRTTPRLSAARPEPSLPRRRERQGTKAPCAGRRPRRVDLAPSTHSQQLADSATGIARKGNELRHTYSTAPPPPPP